MRYDVMFATWLCLTQAQAEKSPRIIIVGCGASGIAAATRLIQNGFNNITIIEAENRIGGRVYTTPFAGYVVDVGGQWVHGEEDNLSYEMAWPLGLLEYAAEEEPHQLLFDSAGSLVQGDLGDELLEVLYDIAEDPTSYSYSNKSMGYVYTLRVTEFLNDQPQLTAEQRKSLMDMVELFQMGLFGGDNWFNLPMDLEEAVCDGDQLINWKERGYSMILDILMKKYPDPTQELPVLNHTVLNTEVTNINYDSSSGDIRVTTANADEYSAEHVIFTPSIGVLKADYETLFDPPLPEAKINAIKIFITSGSVCNSCPNFSNLGEMNATRYNLLNSKLLTNWSTERRSLQHIEFGVVVKIFLSYPEPWWTNGDYSDFNFFWREEDKSEYENDPEKSWMLGLVAVFPVEHKPRLLCAWVTGPHAREMENIPDDRVFEQIKEFFHRFMGKTQTLTEPTEMMRSKWLSNKHFRGAWSYRSLETERSGTKTEDLSEPVTKDGNPLLLFAGEATHSKHPSTVHGAIGSGWREADRLIKLYAKRKYSTNAN